MPVGMVSASLASVTSVSDTSKAEAGPCALGEWEAFDEVDGARAGWLATVKGRGVAEVVEALGER